MKKYFITVLALLSPFFVFAVAQAVFIVPQGGTGVGTLTGLIKGNGTSAFSAITNSAGVAGVITDETGTGSLVFSDTPTFTTTINIPGERATSSGGILYEASGGTDVGILGVGNTANAEWYGSHNFSAATQDTIAGFLGSGKTLSSLTTATYPSLTELSYVKGVTSAIQTQLNGKLASSDYDDATAAETNTGTSTTKYVSPDGLAGSYAGAKNIDFYVLDSQYLLTTGDGKIEMRVPSTYNGMNIVEVGCSVNTTSSSGTPTIQLARGRQSSATSAHSYVDVLSTRITIDANEYDSKDATTAPVINTSNDDLATGDILRWDIDVIGTGTRGLICNIVAQLP